MNVASTVISGAEDGSVRLSNIETGKVLGQMAGAHLASTSGQLEDCKHSSTFLPLPGRCSVTPQTDWRILCFSA